MTLNRIFIRLAHIDMADDNITKSKSRGIIIVDACCLINMCKQPKHSKGIDSFLGCLSYLGQHGFTVIIPEFVAIEVTNKCPTRELETVLNKLRRTPLGHPENRRKFLDFIETNGDHIVVEKAKPTDRSGNPLPYFRVCELIREAVEMAKPEYADTHAMPNNYNKNPREYWQARAKTTIDKAIDAIPHQDLGEIHCFRVMLDHMIEEWIKGPDALKTPVYFLSDDTVSNKGIFEEFVAPLKEQLKPLKNPPTLNFLTVAGFFRALGNDQHGRQTSILKRMGFSEKPEDIIHLMFEDDRRYDRVWNSKMRDNAVLTQTPLYVQRFPFGNAIDNLRHDLERGARNGGTVPMSDRYFRDGQAPGRG
jgi:hypothetical protein